MIRPKDLARRTRQLIRSDDGRPESNTQERRIAALEAEVKALRAELGAVMRMIDTDGTR